jgi:hypothetical protein
LVLLVATHSVLEFLELEEISSMLNTFNKRNVKDAGEFLYKKVK